MFRYGTNNCYGKSLYILKRKMISIYHWYCVLNLPKRLFTFIKICCNCNWILAEKILIFIQKYGNTFHYLSQIVCFIESLGIAHCCQKRNLSFQNKLFQSITDRPCDSLFTTLSQKGDFVSNFSYVRMTLEWVLND